jgi:hypothetical protein
VNLTIADLKTLLYSSMLAVGTICIGVSLLLYCQLTPGPDNIPSYFASFILLLGGCISTLFGLEAFYLNDEDIWR